MSATPGSGGGSLEDLARRLRQRADSVWHCFQAWPLWGQVLERAMLVEHAIEGVARNSVAPDHVPGDEQPRNQHEHQYGEDARTTQSAVMANSSHTGYLRECSCKSLPPATRPRSSLPTTHRPASGARVQVSLETARPAKFGHTPLSRCLVRSIPPASL